MTTLALLFSLAAQYETAQFILLQQKAQLASRIQLELISGGNIRFEEGTVNDVWSVDFSLRPIGEKDFSI
jgi:hypothetical protein